MITLVFLLSFYEKGSFLHTLSLRDFHRKNKTAKTKLLYQNMFLTKSGEGF